MKIKVKGISTLTAVVLLGALVATPLTYFLVQKRFYRRPGTIVLLNGTSSAGKTSIMKALQNLFGDSYVAIVGDEWLETYAVEHPLPESMPRDEQQKQILSDLFVYVKKLSLEGKNVFVDVVEFDDNYDHYCSILDCTKMTKIL